MGALSSALSAAAAAEAKMPDTANTVGSMRESFIVGVQPAPISYLSKIWSILRNERSNAFYNECICLDIFLERLDSLKDILEALDVLENKPSCRYTSLAFDIDCTCLMIVILRGIVGIVVRR